jgi:hypothetical protein
MTLTIGNFKITPIAPTEVTIFNLDGEGGVFPIHQLEEAIAKFFAEHF